MTKAIAMAVTDNANLLTSVCQSTNNTTIIKINVPFLVRDIHLRCTSERNATSPRILEMIKRLITEMRIIINTVNNNLCSRRKSTANAILSTKPTTYINFVFIMLNQYYSAQYFMGNTNIKQGN